MNMNILHTFPQPATLEIWQYIMIWVLILGITVINLIAALKLADYLFNKYIKNKINKKKSVSTNDAISLSNLSDKE